MIRVVLFEVFNEAFLIQNVVGILIIDILHVKSLPIYSLFIFKIRQHFIGKNKLGALWLP